MKHADHIADTLSIAGIRLLAILHGLLFVAFLATLLLLAPKAGAGELPACSGQDLVAELQARDPGRLAAIRDKRIKHAKLLKEKAAELMENAMKARPPTRLPPPRSTPSDSNFWPRTVPPPPDRNR